MFHMNTPTSVALREELERIREMELLTGSQAQLDLTRQLDQSMARQNRLRNQSSNVASIFGQEPRNWPRADRSTRQGNARNGAGGPSPRQGNVRRVRNLDDRPAGVSGGVPPPQSTSPRHLDPLSSSSDFMETTEESSRSHPNRNNNRQRNNRATQNRTAAARPVQSQRTTVARCVAPPVPGISFDVPLNSPNGGNNHAQSEDSSSGSDTYRSGDTEMGSSSETFRAAQAGATSGNTTSTDAGNSPQPETSSQSGNTSQPPPLRRQGTFTRDSENSNENAGSSGENSTNINRPVVNDESVSFNILLDIDGDLDDEETVSTFRLSTSDLLTTMRPLNNYQIKGIPNRVIGNGRGNEVGKFSSPRGIAVSPINDSIVVADSSNHR